MFQPKWKNHSKLTKATYSTWCDMVQRCHNPSCPGYERYGARGIIVCDRWRLSYDDFVEDMGFRPIGLTIDRIENNGNYEPDNCRWATPHEQSRNTSRTILLTFLGETKLAVDWADQLKIPRNTVMQRIERGLPVEQILSQKTLVPEPQHGTVSMYVSRKCRCTLCRTANNEYMRKNKHKFPSMTSEARKKYYESRRQSRR